MRRIFLAFMFLGLTSTAPAAEAVLKSCKGAVSVRSAATRKWVKARPGLALNRNDVVKTGATGLVQLAFKSGALMLVKQGSHLSLTRDKRGALVSFRAGEFLIGLRKKLAGNERFRVRTPVAVGAIRGTVFWGKHDSGMTSFACLTGSIDVWGGGSNVVLQPGQLTTVAKESGPRPPEPHGIAPGFVQTFAIDGSLQGIDAQLQDETATP
jgi:hypothetical protein